MNVGKISHVNAVNTDSVYKKPDHKVIKDSDSDPSFDKDKVLKRYEGKGLFVDRRV